MLSRRDRRAGPPRRQDDSDLLVEAARILEDRLAGLDLMARSGDGARAGAERRMAHLALAAEMVRQAVTMPTRAEVEGHLGAEVGPGQAVQAA